MSIPTGRGARRAAMIMSAILLALVFAAVLTHLQGGSSSALAQDESVATSVSALRTPASSDDNVSRWRVTTAMNARGNPEGFEFASARVVHRSPSRTFALVRSREGLCLMAEASDGSGGLNCAPPNEFPDSLGYGSSIGIVPDAVKSVTFTMVDGRSETVPVVGNVWKAPPEAAAVDFQVGSRARRVELMPLSALPDGATVSPAGVVNIGAPPS